MDLCGNAVKDSCARLLCVPALNCARRPRRIKVGALYAYQSTAEAERPTASRSRRELIWRMICEFAELKEVNEMFAK